MTSMEASIKHLTSLTSYVSFAVTIYFAVKDTYDVKDVRCFIDASIDVIHIRF
jgi:hypothetical protein